MVCCPCTSQSVSAHFMAPFLVRTSHGIGPPMPPSFHADWYVTLTYGCPQLHMNQGSIQYCSMDRLPRFLLRSKVLVCYLVCRAHNWNSGAFIRYSTEAFHSLPVAGSVWRSVWVVSGLPVFLSVPTARDKILVGASGTHTPPTHTVSPDLL
jgi:hypothetical protein